MKALETKTTRVETRKRIELSEVDIRDLIQSVTGDTIPVTAEIYVQIPGGGDWSNTSLDISDSPLIIAWMEVVETNE